MVGHLVWDAVEASAGVLVCLILWSGIVNYWTGMRARLKGRHRG